MKGIEHLYPDEIKLGEAKITKFVFNSKEDFLFNLRAIRDDPAGYMHDGTYVRLHVNGTLVMSDTHLERKTNREFHHKVNGKVLIAGLGLGLILNCLEDKKKEIEKVTVIEKSKDVIDLISLYFPWVEVIHADIFEWTTDEKWDTIYFDIWPDRDTENLNGIRKLHNKFKFKLNRDNPNAWRDSWSKEELQRIKRQDQHNGW